MRATLLCVSLVLAPALARADDAPDRFARTFSVGASVGVGGPRGVAGAFMELRPWRALALSAGATLGGSFGPGFDGTLTLTPVGTTGWTLGASGSLSRQLMWSDRWGGLQLPAGRTMPTHSDWASVAVVNEFRPSSSMMLRLSVGRSWLLNRGAFHVVRSEELPLLDGVDPGIPGATPLDAARAAARGQDFGVWFVQLDIAPTWRW